MTMNLNEAIVRVVVYEAMDDRYEYSYYCWVAYDKFENVVATVRESDVLECEWLHPALDRQGSFVQRHRCAYGVYLHWVEEGRRLEQHQPVSDELAPGGLTDG